MFKSLIVRFAVKFPVVSRNSLRLLVAGQLKLQAGGLLTSGHQ